ncbi:putative nAD-dependent deacetylase 1 [Pseudomonas fluorescens]|uniref:Putative nAD-dependent deacetylase 1 n=1 Tax=Pseudomonas fluorescens TaxID=294 RepID=A0A0P8XUS0_PSEFL|nr:putative nAD-dependent deacetylase 1 [Pseudomonas fluorescens]
MKRPCTLVKDTRKEADSNHRGAVHATGASDPESYGLGKCFLKRHGVRVLLLQRIVTCSFQSVLRVLCIRQQSFPYALWAGALR